MVKKLSVFLLSCLLPLNIAIAADVDLSWTAPTENEDGSPLTDLAGYKIYYGLSSGIYDVGEVDIPDPTALTYTVTGLTNGTTYYFVATAYNTSNIESQYSNEAVHTMAPLRPNPPGGLTVNPEDLVVYTYSISADKLVMIPVGTVLGGTPCDSTMSMNGLHRVDRDVVDYIGTIRPPVVFAECV